MTVRVLVTGGAGYIGSHVCKSLAAHGYLPVTYDDCERGHAPSVRWGPLERGDIRDRVHLDAVLARHRPAAAIHLAAYAYVGESVEHPTRYYLNNVGGSVSLFAALVSAGVPNLVSSSTCAVYGPPVGVLSEDHPQRPVNPYGASKAMVERALADVEVAHGLRAVSLRYFNAAGADPDGELAERHEPETHLVPLVLQVAAGKRDVVTIHGDDYPTRDGTCVRDYVHVTDLADAHVRALRYLEEGGPSATCNLGTGRGWSVREVIETARQVTGCDIPTTVGGRRAGDPPELVAAAGRAKQLLGWEPRRSAMTQMIADAWRVTAR